MKSRFYIVDVFTGTKYGGNQLAVFEPPSTFTTGEMQKIALEMNYSETTFIISDRERDGGYEVRIFSLDEELPFAGHPTLGTAYIIQRFIIGSEIPGLILNMPIGKIPVTFSYENSSSPEIWMGQQKPKFGKTFDPEVIAHLLEIERDSIDRRFPVEEVSTGLPYLIVPLKDLESLKKCSVNIKALRELKGDGLPISIYVFSPETYVAKHNLNCRMLDPLHGIAEDPATGSAAGCLGAYLVKNRYFEEDCLDLVLEQGYEINRPSQIYLRAKKDSGDIKINVGGRVILTATGELV